MCDRMGATASPVICRYRSRAFCRAHLQGVLSLCRAEGWPSLARDPKRALAALTAPGVICVVALREGEVVGFLQLLTDGVVTGYVSLIAVAGAHRREGVGRKLVEEAFARSTLGRLDLLTEESAHEFYRSFEHRKFAGFRIYSDATN